MADSHDKLKLQQAHATNLLNYGHLGTGTYLEHSTNWAFLRGISGRSGSQDLLHNATAFPFEFVGAEDDVFPSQCTRDIAELEFRPASSSTRNAPKSLPETLLELTSNQQSNATATHPQNSDIQLSALRPSQLAFGGAVAVSGDGKSRQTVPVAAIVSGDNLDAVGILLIGKELLQTTDQKGLLNKYHLPKIAYDEKGYWIGDGDPVEQICFAAVHDLELSQSAWMAARCRSNTTIFHPLLYKNQGKFDTSMTRINPNPILQLPISRTGGYSHSDVAFHPQDHTTFAVVDVRGNWSVWKIETPRRSMTSHVTFGIHLVSAGKLLTGKKRFSSRDEWHKICWIGTASPEANRLLVSSRSRAAIFSSGGQSLGDLNLRLGGDHDIQLVLDIAMSTTNPAHCYVLTSTKLLLLSAAENDVTGPLSRQQMAMVLSWSHYRDRADLSLRLTLAETAQGTTVLITSEISSMVTACRMGQALGSSSTPTSRADPLHFDLWANIVTEERSTLPRILAFRELQTQTRAGLAASDHDPLFFKAFAEDAGHPIQEILFRCTEAAALRTAGRSYSSAIPLAVHRKFGQKSGKYADVADESGFVIADNATPWTEGSVQRRLSSRALEENQLHTQAGLGTLDWQDLYAKLGDVSELNHNWDNPTEVTVALESLRLRLKDQPQCPVMIQTLGEIFDAKTTLNDVETASTALSDFTTNPSRIEKEELRISQLPILGRGTGFGTVSDIYDQIKANYILPLSPDLDNSVRLTKDRLARSLAADLALASITVGPAWNVGQPQAQPSQETLQDHGSTNLPSSLPSVASNTSEPATEDPACARLRRYTPLTKPIPPISTSKALTDMLAHLPADTTTRPSEYDWRATEARIKADRSAEEADQLDPKARRRRERQAALHRRRIEAQKQLSQAVEQNSAPLVVVSSQYQPPVREVQSSQGGPSAAQDDPGYGGVSVSMSQPARGPFGSRIASDGKAQGAKKKSRKQGF